MFFFLAWQLHTCIYCILIYILSTTLSVPFFLLLKAFFFPRSLVLIFTSFVLFCIYTLSLVRGAYMSMVRENSPVSTALEKISSSLPCWNVERLDSVQASAVNYSRGNFMSATAMSHSKISPSSSIDMITTSF